MHHIQVACIARHGADVAVLPRVPARSSSSSSCSSRSITSEVGVWGDTRSSICARRARGRPLQARQGRDHGLVRRARRRPARHRAAATPDAPPSDQVLVLVRKGDYTLDADRRTWDTLGMRGTCSPGFKLIVVGARGAGAARLVRRRVGADDGVVLAHPVVGACGSASPRDAVARAPRVRARRGAQEAGHGAAARRTRLAEAVGRAADDAQQRARRRRAEFDEIMARPTGMEELLTIGWALKMNNLKVALVGDGAADRPRGAADHRHRRLQERLASSRVGRHYRDVAVGAR